MLLLIYGMLEIGWLFHISLAWQRGVDVLADAAAIRVATRPGESWNSGWNALVDSERVKTRSCGDATVTFPDGSQDPGNRVTVAWTCVHKALTGVIPDLSSRIESTSVIPLAAPSPQPSPS
jgi:Flp pilus assembly protein TadG